MTAAVLAVDGRRWSLDQLVGQMTEPGFVTRYCRVPSLRETNGHVSPAILALEPPRSKYVRRWRRHARRCPQCAGVFRYLGLKL